MNMVFFMMALFGVMYFLMIRPNQKREKERQAMLSALSKGDRVVTAGGIFGTIVGLTEKTVVLRVSEEPGVKIEFLRSAVSRAVPRDGKGE
ncbi:MAG: preprotein translocase subunit YajC [Candidatus Hydrogenedentes bacterium]|nr:preprotein translocase subunit YajC [Candidatus Hydrogenedentota bacterium]